MKSEEAIMIRARILHFVLIIIASGIFMAGFSPATPIEPVPIGSVVYIDARVLDGNGNYVQGLKAEDFELYENGRPKEIVKFYQPGSTNREACKIIFIIDDLSLPKDKYKQVRAAIRHFANNVMRPTDVAGVASTRENGVVLQPLTSDPSKLRAATDQWQWDIKSEIAKPNTAILQSRSTIAASPLQPGVSGASRVSSISSNIPQPTRITASQAAINATPVFRSCSGGT
jgi:VWFA-related protein